MLNVRPKQLSVSGELIRFSHWLKENCKHIFSQKKNKAKTRRWISLTKLLLIFEEQLSTYSERLTNLPGRFFRCWYHDSSFLVASKSVIHSSLYRLNGCLILMVRTYMAVFGHFQIRTQRLHLFCTSTSQKNSRKSLKKLKELKEIIWSRKWACQIWRHKYLFKYIKKNPGITKPRHSEHIFSVPWTFVLSRFNCITGREWKKA